MNDSEGLFLPSLRVEGVRAIRSLRIESLGRVNLFVGANNVGKTSLLEALRLYAARGIPQAFRDILQVRGNVLSPTPGDSLEEWGILVEAVQSLFHGGLSRTDGLALQVGPETGEGPTLTVQLKSRGTSDQDDSPRRVSAGFPALVIGYGDEHTEVGVDTLALQPRPYIENQVSFAVFVPPSGIDEGRLGTLWDRVTLTEWERPVLEALRIIVPGLRGLSFIIEGGRRRVPVAKLEDSPRPVPLRNMGDGVNRLLSISLAMVNAREGFLLIDEFENGLHYSVQEEVWRAIFALARDLQVQVFATTHSWDCIQAFAAASNDSAEVDGMLHRLERKRDDSLRTVDLDEADLAVITRQHIEVR